MRYLRRSFSWMMLVVLSISTLSAQTTEKKVSAKPKTMPAQSEAGKIPEIQFEKYMLPNGLQVVLHVDRKLPIVHVNQWYHVGSKNEARGRTGFAHLFE